MTRSGTDFMTVYKKYKTHARKDSLNSSITNRIV